MADILQLPTAAREPVINHRRRGSYGRKVASLNSRRLRHPKRGEGVLDPRVLGAKLDGVRQSLDLEEITEALHQLARDGELKGLAFVVELDEALCKAGVVGSLKEDWALANTVWMKLHVAMFMAERKED